MVWHRVWVQQSQSADGTAIAQSVSEIIINSTQPTEVRRSVYTHISSGSDRHSTSSAASSRSTVQVIQRKPPSPYA